MVVEDSVCDNIVVQPEIEFHNFVRVNLSYNHVLVNPRTTVNVNPFVVLAIPSGAQTQASSQHSTTEDASPTTQEDDNSDSTQHIVPTPSPFATGSSTTDTCGEHPPPELINVRSTTIPLHISSLNCNRLVKIASRTPFKYLSFNLFTTPTLDERADDHHEYPDLVAPIGILPFFEIHGTNHPNDDSHGTNHPNDDLSAKVLEKTVMSSI
ncbi:unnamed protein product [Absidia cylindrospora]